MKRFRKLLLLLRPPSGAVVVDVVKADAARVIGGALRMDDALELLPPLAIASTAGAEATYCRVDVKLRALRTPAALGLYTRSEPTATDVPAASVLYWWGWEAEVAGVPRWRLAADLR